MTTSVDELMAFTVFSEDEVERIGIGMISRRSVRNGHVLFPAHFGSTAAVLADQFMDLQTTDIEGAKLTAEENSEDGLKSFLAAHYWLWIGPKNSHVMSTHLGLYEKACRGKPVWHWIEKISCLESFKIVWDKQAKFTDGAKIFSITTDGVDFKRWEPKHPRYPIDKKQCSHKFKSAGYRYLVCISVQTGHCVKISPPFPASTHDMVIFFKCVKPFLRWEDGVIGGKAFGSSRPDEFHMSRPNTQDEQELAKFKSRARCRHESFNKRMKNFASMDHTWRLTTDQHRQAFTVVALTVQY